MAAEAMALCRGTIPSVVRELYPRPRTPSLGLVSSVAHEVRISHGTVGPPRGWRGYLPQWRIRFHPRYFNQWLAERRITPQKPRFQCAAGRRRSAAPGGGLAANKKSAARRRAHIVLIDESGFLLSPLVRRTLAPRGQTPVLKTWGGYRERVSAMTR